MRARAFSGGSQSRAALQAAAKQKPARSRSKQHSVPLITVTASRQGECDGDHRTLHIAYTPDSDDAFYYDALEAGQMRLPGYNLKFHRAPMSVLNRAAMHGEHVVTAISSVLYPRIADRYAILNTGTSVGRGYGPVLVSKHPISLAELRGRQVGVGGIPTTGWFLLRLFCPDAVPIEMPFDAIASAVSMACSTPA
jgi:1,4-dihydroxy-6-naphthoate synthase